MALMKQQLKEKRQKLGEAWKAYTDFRDGLDKDETKWTAEQREKFDKLDKDVDDLEKDIESLEKRVAQNDKDKEREKRFSESQGREYRHNPEGGESDAVERRRMELFSRALVGGVSCLSEEERRDMTAGVDTAGGYLVAPQQFAAGILKAADSATVVRGLATVQQLIQSASLGIVKLDDDVDDWAWTTELKTGSTDSGLGFGKREMRPHPLAKRIKLSRTLARLAPNIQRLVQDRLAVKFASTMESNYMTGDGVGKPLGLFTASSDGISTSRDSSTDMATTAITADGLISAQNALKDAYSNNARWLFHRDAITKIRKLKDSNNQYLWQPGLQAGIPQMILGTPYVKSDFVPNTFATGKYVGMLADFSYYWIVDALDMQMQILYELYAETNQIGYIGRYEGDGQPVLEEAFVRLKLA